MSRNFYSRTCVKFTFANKIEAIHERLLVSVKVEPRSTSHLSSALYLASILFTCVNVCSQKRVSGNQPLYYFLLVLFDGSFHIHTILLVATLIQFVNSPCILLSFSFLSRWVLERVELEAGPEHPRIKIVPED